MTFEVTQETPAGVGAVSVVRVRGENALGALSALLAAPGNATGRVADPSIGVPRLVRLRVGGEDLDEAILCVRSARELEIHVHGSPVLVRTLIEAIAPQAGTERPSRAASSRARAEDLLARAPCESGARILLDQAEGAWSGFLGALAVSPEPRRMLDEIGARSRIARFALEPALVVLAGPVNAGKSTLFNVLVGERRAITSPSPGTTRDLVRARVLLGRYAVDLVDTAGEREVASDHAAALVERAGIERARSARARADLVVWLCDASQPAVPAPSGALCIGTQADRVAQLPDGVAQSREGVTQARTPALSAAVSATTAPEGARALFTNLVRARFALPEDPWTPGTACAFDAPSRAVLDALGALASTSELQARARVLAEEDASAVAARAGRT